MTDSTLADALTNGLDSLSDLARQEYPNLDLNQLVEQAAQHDQISLQRLSRLVGVALKQPFAKPHDIFPSNSATGAHRTWRLDAKSFESASVKASWQYSILDQLKKEDWILPLRGFQPGSVEELAEDALYERGFWWYMARSAHSYICGNKKLEQQLEAATAQVQQQGGPAALVSRQALLAAGSSTVATVLVQTIPWLSVAAAPVLTGLVIVICSIGIKGFCDWAADRLQDPELVP